MCGVVTRQMVTLFNFYSISRVQYILVALLRVRVDNLKPKLAVKRHKTLWQKDTKLYFIKLIIL